MVSSGKKNVNAVIFHKIFKFQSFLTIRTLKNLRHHTWSGLILDNFGWEIRNPVSFDKFSKSQLFLAIFRDGWFWLIFKNPQKIEMLNLCWDFQYKPQISTFSMYWGGFELCAASSSYLVSSVIIVCSYSLDFSRFCVRLGSCVIQSSHLFMLYVVKVPWDFSDGLGAGLF